MAQKAHFIGICGVGMSATAHLLQEAGYEVSGSDTEYYPPASDYVARLGIKTFSGYAPEHIPPDADRVVIGRNAKLAPDTNPEVAAALRNPASVRSFPEVLAELSKNRHTVVVAGSYGKSTVTALITWCLVRAGGHPGSFIGAFVNGLEHTSSLGTDEPFIIEGDEYPTAHWDARAKFLHLFPTDLVLTSAVHDHINVYPTPKSYRQPFIELIKRIPDDGLILVCADEPNVAHVLGERAHVSYGFDSSAEWSARDITYGETSSFMLTHKGEDIMTIETRLLGAHNIQNIIAAAAYLLDRGWLEPAEVATGIASFAGVVRRLDRKQPEGLVPVYEGFGSSYEKARAGYAALRLHYPARRIVTVFEPHTFSWRNRDSLGWYDSAFDGVDVALIYKPAEQGADTHKQLTLDEIVGRAQKGAAEVSGHETPDSVLGTLEKILRPDDVVVLMTSGGMDGLIEEIPRHIAARFAK